MHILPNALSKHARKINPTEGICWHAKEMYWHMHKDREKNGEIALTLLPTWNHADCMAWVVCTYSSYILHYLNLTFCHLYLGQIELIVCLKALTLVKLMQNAFLGFFYKNEFICERTCSRHKSNSKYTAIESCLFYLFCCLGIATLELEFQAYFSLFSWKKKKNGKKKPFLDFLRN